MRYRGLHALQYAKEKMGVDSSFYAPDRSILGVVKFFQVWLSALFFRKSTDIVIIQKVTSTGLYAFLLKVLVYLRPNHTVYDIDDAEYVRKPVSSLHYFLKNCKKVTVGSEALREYCLEFNTHVVVQTSPVVEHAQRKRGKNDVFTLGWVGDFGCNETSEAYSHKTSLYTLLFPAVLQLDFPLVLQLYGITSEDEIQAVYDLFRGNENVMVKIAEELDWKEDVWLYEAIKQFDVGVSPMVQHPFNEAKSAFKAKQYLSCGVPVLASPVGENKNFVSQELNGSWCCNADEFAQEITRFYEMDFAQYAQWIERCSHGRSSYGMAQFCKEMMEMNVSNVAEHAHPEYVLVND